MELIAPQSVEQLGERQQRLEDNFAFAPAKQVQSKLLPVAEKGTFSITLQLCTNFHTKTDIFRQHLPEIHRKIADNLKNLKLLQSVSLERSSYPILL